MRQLIVYLCLITLVGCSTLINVNFVSLGQDLNWKIQPASSMNQVVDQTVLLTAKHNGKTHKMIVSTQSESNTFAMVAMTVQGVPLFELVLDDQGKITNKTYISLPIKAEYILSDMQIISLPFDEVKKNLLGNNVDVEISANGKKRMISNDQSTVINIEYKNNTTQFIHHQRNYELIIEAIKK